MIFIIQKLMCLNLEGEASFPFCSLLASCALLSQMAHKSYNQHYSLKVFKK